MDEKIREEILTLLDLHRIMTVATLRPDGWPQATTVGYVNEGLTLYFLCGLDSQKAKNLALDNRLSLTIDHDTPNLMAITGLSMAARAHAVEDRAAVRVAAQREQPEFLQLLLRHGVDHYGKAAGLRSAVGFSRWQSMQLLLKAGADVNIPIPLVGSTRIGIDYEASGSSRMVPITVTQIFQPGALVVKSPIYFGTGIGLWNTHINGGGESTRLGFRVLAGLEFKGLFVEANYDAVGRISGASGLRNSQRRTVASVACTDTYSGDSRYSTIRSTSHDFRFVRVAKLP